jgi:hypothetical protein
MGRIGLWPTELNIPKIMPPAIVGLDLMRITRVIETMLNKGYSEPLLMVMCETYKKGGVRYIVDPSGHDSPAEFFEIWLRTQIARDKLMFYELGLFKTLEESRGDLRTGKFVVNELEQIYALTELEEARKDPRFIDRVKQEAAKMNPVFFQRMGRLLKSPVKKCEELSGTNLQRFLLNFWAFETKDRKGQVVPPLCFFSDPAIADLAKYCLGVDIGGGLDKSASGPA